MFTTTTITCGHKGLSSEYDERKLAGPILDVDYDVESPSSIHVPSLQDLCGKKIVSDSYLIRSYSSFIPNKISIFIMDKALEEGRFPTISFLMKNWPHRQFQFPLLPVLRNWKLSSSLHKGGISKSLRRALECVAVVLRTFLEMVQKGHPYTKLKSIDLSVVPLSEKSLMKICNCIYDTSLLATGQTISGNTNTPGKRSIQVQCTLSSCGAVDALYYALLADKMGLASIKLSVSGLRFTNTSVRSQKTKDLLEILDPLVLRVLSFDFASITDQTMKEIISSLHNFHSLRVLDFAYSGLRGQNCHLLQDSLKELVHISRLDFTNCKVGDHVGHMLEHLHKNEPATPPSYPPVASKKLKVICSYPSCQVCPSEGLEYLNLSGCSVSASDLVWLANSPHAKTLKSLNLCNNLLGTHFKSLLKLLRALASSLCVLEIGDAYFKEHHIDDLFAALLEMENLRFLNITNLRASHLAQLRYLPELCRLPYLRTLLLSPPHFSAGYQERDSFTSEMVRLIKKEREDIVIHWQNL